MIKKCIIDKTDKKNDILRNIALKLNEVIEYLNYNEQVKIKSNYNIVLTKREVKNDLKQYVIKDVICNVENGAYLSLSTMTLELLHKLEVEQSKDFVDDFVNKYGCGCCIRADGIREIIMSRFNLTRALINHFKIPFSEELCNFYAYDTEETLREYVKYIDKNEKQYLNNLGEINNLNDQTKYCITDLYSTPVKFDYYFHIRDRQCIDKSKCEYLGCGYNILDKTKTLWEFFKHI